MQNYKLETSFSWGNTFEKVSVHAKKIAIVESVTVEFDFNGVKCLVNSSTNLDYLLRDYMNSWTMGWKEVGADCVEKYSPEVQAEFDTKKKLAEEKQERESAEYAKKEKEEKMLFNEKVKGIEIELLSEADWQKGKDKNTDGYGAAIYEYAEGWAKLMQREMNSGKLLKEIAENTSHELGFMGITGFMYGAAVSILSHCWKHGEELRKWHNKEYNHEGDGVVNPAIFTISK